MVQAESEIALRFHGVDHAQEAVVLDLRKFHALVRRLVTNAEVREHALELERAMEADLVHEVHHFVPAHADAVHARVDGQMVRRAQPHGIRGLGIFDGELG